MSPPRIELRLESGTGPIRAGTVLAGEVRVTSETALGRATIGLCAAFASRRPDVTTGPQTGRVLSATLSEGEAAGGTYAWPFQLEVPATIETRTGPLFEIRYELQVDLRTEERHHVRFPVVIEPAPEAGLQVEWDDEAVADGHGRLRESMLGSIAGVALLGVAIAFDSTLALVIGAGLGLLGLFTTLGNLKPWLAERRTGRLGVAMALEAPKRIRVTVSAATLDRFSSLTAELSVEEYVRRAQPETTAQEWAHPLYRVTQGLEPDDEGRRSATLELPAAGQVPFPAEIGHRSSSPATAYAIDWRLRLRGELDGWPDWSREIELRAKPERQSSSG